MITRADQRKAIDCHYGSIKDMYVSEADLF